MNDKNTCRYFPSLPEQPFLVEPGISIFSSVLLHEQQMCLHLAVDMLIAKLQLPDIFFLAQIQHFRL